MEINKGVATTIDEQIDALEIVCSQLNRISFSSGFNWHHITECEEIFSFEDFNNFNSKLHNILQKLEELKKNKIIIC